MVDTASSMLRVTCCSISCGEAPGYTVEIETTGNDTSGKRSTGKRNNASTPITMIAAATMVVNTGRSMETVAIFMVRLALSAFARGCALALVRRLLFDGDAVAQPAVA